MLKLPNDVTTVQEMLNLLNDLEALKQEDVTRRARAKATSSHLERLHISKLIHELFDINDRHINPKEIDKTLKELTEISKHPPVVRVVFGAEPSKSELTTIAKWFRQATHQPLLLRVGVQPHIAAGCILQTPNRRFDLTLNKALNQNVAHLGEVMHRG